MTTILGGLIMLPAVSNVSPATRPTGEEIAAVNSWVQASIAPSAFEGFAKAAPMFSFTLDGQPSSGFLSQWKCDDTSTDATSENPYRELRRTSKATIAGHP